ncbi:hypothetical protein AcV7_006964 [Taiwanofungus camphoratus]|nr:hypothetical protein AcV7_006964 [Antrodia cinnamomea]
MSAMSFRIIFNGAITGVVTKHVNVASGRLVICRQTATSTVAHLAQSFGPTLTAVAENSRSEFTGVQDFPTTCYVVNVHVALFFSIKRLGRHGSPRVRSKNQSDLKLMAYSCGFK